MENNLISKGFKYFEEFSDVVDEEESSNIVDEEKIANDSSDSSEVELAVQPNKPIIFTKISKKVKDVVDEVKINFMLFNYVTMKFDIKSYEVKKNDGNNYYFVNMITDKGEQQIQIEETPEKVSLESPKNISLTSGFAIIAYIVFFIIFILILSTK